MSNLLSFDTTVNELLDMVTKVSSLVPSNPSLSAHAGIHFVVENDILKLTSSDGEAALVLTRKVSSPTEGSFLVLPRPVRTFLQRLDRKLKLHVEVNTDNDLLLTPEGFNTYSFRPLASTFPPLVSLDSEPVSTDFSSLPDALALCRSTGGSSVQLVSKGSSLVMNATDSFRLVSVEVPKAGFGDFTGVLSTEMLEEVLKIEPSSVVVDSSGRLLQFKSVQAELTARLLAVPFPPFETVTAARPEPITELDASLLSTALNRISAVAENAPVSVSFSESTMTVNVSSAEVGTGSEQVELSKSVPVEFTVRLRANFLHDAARALSPSRIQVAYSSPTSPVFFTSSDPLKAVYAVMPQASTG